MADLPGLRLLLQGYLNVDWPEDYNGDSWAAVDDFAASEPEAAATLAAEIEAVLTRCTSEDEVRQLVISELGSGYLAEADGHAYRDWLQQVARRVQRSSGD